MATVFSALRTRNVLRAARFPKSMPIVRYLHTQKVSNSEGGGGIYRIAGQRWLYVVRGNVATPRLSRLKAGSTGSLKN